MARAKKALQRREDSLSRESIVAAAVELLDSEGEDGLTFRALSERLATGPGAIYWHVANKNDLLTEACDAVVARTLGEAASANTPKKAIRDVALAIFDLIDERPWVGSALTSAPGLTPIVRILERVGQQVRAMGVPPRQQWSATGTLMAYMLGVSRQNAANGQLARTRGLDRDEFLDTLATAWSQLDAEQYPFARSVAGRLRGHDDREDYLTGIDIILAGMRSGKLQR